MSKEKLTKNGAKVKLREPRSIDEITSEYNTIRAKVADAQYNAFVYTLETENLNKMLLNLNQEASARKQLDAGKAEETTQQGAQNA